MKIELDYDATANAAPAGFKTAMQYAANQLDALITDNVTISISVSWNNAYLGLGGPDNMQDYDYATVVAALKSHASSATATQAADSLPIADPTAGQGIYLSGAQAEALGLATAADYPGPEGEVTFGAGGASLNFSTTNFAIPSEIDFVGVAEHELTHAIGRTDFGESTPVSLLDLYRYSAPGIASTDAFAPAYFSIDDGATNLANFSTFSDYSDWATTSPDDSFDAISYAGVANTISAADQALLAAIGFDIACFRAGTRILTPSGPVPVERLAEGDAVITQFHGAQRIAWIGYSHYGARFTRNNLALHPIRIAAGALAPNIPCRDLYVSPDHALCLSGALIPASHLVNGVTITQPHNTGPISYYHLELPTHDILFAEDCPAESFIDLNSRRCFHNAAEYFCTHPRQAAPQTECLPRIEHGFALQKIQRRINHRAGLAEPRYTPGPLRGFIDIAGPDRIAGWAQTITQPERPVELDIFADNRRIARTLANHFRSDLRAAALGSGKHGFDVPLPHPISPQTQIDIRRTRDQSPLPRTATAKAA